MNQRHLGVILILVAIIMGVFVHIIGERESRYIIDFEASNGTCFLEDGTCLHEESTKISAFGWSISLILLIIGLYLTFFDTTQKHLLDHTIKVSEALESAKKIEKEKDEFSAFLAGFTEDEQKVLRAVKEQEGIQQSTLRYRTDISKTSLSLMLKSLEDRKIISKKNAGKTNEIYLVKKF